MRKVGLERNDDKFFESMSYVKYEFGVLLMGAPHREPGGRVLTEGFHVDFTGWYTVAEILTVTRAPQESILTKAARWENPI